ncbi:MAG: hypothetical protein DRN65_04500 [Thaumarchaeota archaeon]|nr:MAG: hypothetical protein DRN65_04500 [Nitrososphaerota archaeon]
MISVKVDKELRNRMREVKIDRSETIRCRVELEEKRRAAEKLLDGLRLRRCVVPSGFINEAVRGMREAR